MPFAHCNLGSPKSETARKKAKAKDQGPPHRKFPRTGTGLRPGVEIQVREQENRKEPSFGKDESKNANLVLVRTLDLRGVLADHRVGPVRIRDIPQWPAAADRRQRVKILMRRRRSRSPFQ